MKILLFGRLGEALGREVEVELPPEGCSVAALRSLLAARGSAFATLAAPGARACVDQAIVGEDHLVRPGQELAFIPPLSGG